MQQIEPGALHHSLGEYFAGHHRDGVFIASLDHSPTEQLTGQKWRTSALILDHVPSSGLADGVVLSSSTQSRTKRGEIEGEGAVHLGG